MVKRKEFLLYSIVGILGTVIYFFARFYSKNLTDSVLLPVIIGQAVAVVFAFFGNKFFVFKNTGVGFWKTCQQFLEFCLGRLVVFFIDLGIAHFFVDKYGTFWINTLRLAQINYQNALFSTPMIHRFVGTPFLLNEFIFTILSQTIGVIINYVVSKRIVFNLKQENEIEMVF